MSEALADFEKKLELLKDVHTQEDLEKVKADVEKAKMRALSESAEYRQLLEERHREAEARAEKIRREYDSEISEVKVRADVAISKAESARSEAERMRANLMPGANPSYQPAPSDSGLVYPKCGGTNLNWMVQGKGKHKKRVPWCFRCNVKMSSQKDGKFVRALRPDEGMMEALKKMRGLP